MHFIYNNKKMHERNCNKLHHFNLSNIFVIELAANTFPNIYIYIYIYIYIIIMSYRQHGYLWTSLATSTYYSSPLAGLQGYILYPHIVAVCKFELVVLLWLGHMWGSIGVHHLWARPCFSSSILRVWFV